MISFNQVRPDRGGPMPPPTQVEPVKIVKIKVATFITFITIAIFITF